MFTKASLGKLFSDSLLKKTIASIVILLLPGAVAFLLIYQSTQRHIKNLALNDLTVIAEAYEGQVYQFMEMSYRRAQDFASDGFIRDHLHRIIQGDTSSVEPLNLHLSKNKKPLDPALHFIHITSPDGRIVASTDNTQLGKTLGKVIFSNKMTDSTTLPGKNQFYGAGPALYIQSAITDRLTGEGIGFIVNVISLAEISKVFTGELKKQLGAVSWGMGRHDTVDAYMVNRDRLLITESRTAKGLLSQKADTLPVNQCLQSGKEMTGFYKNYQGVEVAGASMCMPAMQWVLLVEVGAEELMSPVAAMRRDALVTGVFVTGLMVIFSIIFLKGVLIPLRRNAASLARAQRIAHMGNWEWDIVRDKISWSEEVYRIFGLTSREFDATHESFLNLVRPEDRNLVIKAVDEALHGNTYDINYRIILPDGSERIVHEQAEVAIEDLRPVTMAGTVHDITALKQAEEEAVVLKRISMSISESSDIYSVFNLATSIICGYTGWVFGEVWMPSPDNNYLFYASAWFTESDKLNKFKEASLGYKFESGVGLPGRAWALKKPVWVRDVTKDSNFPRAALALEANIKTGVSLPVVLDNEVVAVLTFFLEEVKEKNDHMLDITLSIAAQLGVAVRRKQMEASRASLAKILETTTDFVATFNMDGQILFYNKAARKMLGIPESEKQANSNIMDVLPVFADAIMGTGLSSAISGDGTWNGEAMLVTKGGKEIPVSVVILVYKDAAGATDFFSVIARDITERKRTELKLKNLSIAIEQSVNMIFITDSEGRIEYANHALEAATGWSKKELIGATPRLFKSGETKKELYKDLWTNVLSGSIWRGELKNKTKDGSPYWVNSGVSPIVDENHNPPSKYAIP